VTFRGFIAVDLAPSRALVDVLQELRTSGASLKLASVDQLHTTLKFLGETEEGLADEIARRIRDACAGGGPFSVLLRGTGAFPGLGRMRVLWVGIEEAQPLADIAARLDASLSEIGFAREGRPWSPHVTIARVKGGRGLERVRQILQAHRAEPFGENLVEVVRLKKSVLTPQGPVYSTLVEVPI
jgi:2'-5' RNA ligase